MSIDTLLRLGQTVYLYRLAESADTLVRCKAELVEANKIQVVVLDKDTRLVPSQVLNTEVLMHWEASGSRQECPVHIVAIAGKTLTLSPRAGERRELLRLHLDLPFRYEVITAAEAPVVARQIIDSGGDLDKKDLEIETDRIHHGEDLSEKIDHRFEQLDRYLKQIDAKMDYLIALAEGKPPRQDVAREAQLVDISGSGLGFFNTDEIKIGAYLKLSAQLSRFPLREIESVGRVMRAFTPPDAPRETPYEIGVQFEAIREDDREFLFRFISRAQRQLLRERREAMID